jgi:SAM-dependent methyltransferase
MSALRALWDVWLSRHFWNLRFRSRQHRSRLPDMRVAPADPRYREAAAAEAAFWENPPLNTAILESAQTGAFARFINESYTGDPDISWMEDLVRRGPFARAAVLGCTQGLRESSWLRQGGSRELDVYDISSKVLARARRQVRAEGVAPSGARIRFFRADLSFVDLPENSYDVVWTTACLHHVTNLEYLFSVVEAALRPQGLLAIHDYIGEARFAYAPERRSRANEVFRKVPARFRYAEEILPVADDFMSPFEAIRSDETREIVEARFEVVHLALADALYPLFLLLDLAAIEREEPALLDAIFAAEVAARRDPALRACSMYGVFRRRHSSSGS